MADLGKAYVQIVPSATGISGQIEQVLAPEATKAGKSAGQNISGSIGSVLKKNGKSALLGITAPIAALGAASVGAYKEMHSGLETIIQKTGASGDALSSMQDIMGNLATDLPSDFDTIGSAIGEVNTRFGVTGEDLEALSAQFIKFADLNGTDVSNSVDKVQSAMAAFGLGAEDTGAFLDTLNKVGQDTGVSVDQLASDMMSNAAVMDQLGYSASDAANFIGNLNKNGIDSSSVMAGLKKAYVNAAKDGKTMGEALGDLQSAFENGATDTEAYQEAIDLFGTKAGPALAKAVAEGRLSFDELGTSITDNLGNVDSTFTETLTPMDEFNTAMNSLKVTGAQIGATLMTMVAPVIQKVSNVIKSFAERWNALSPQAQNTIIKIGLIAAAVAPVLGILSKVVGVVSAVGSVIGAVASGPVLAIVGIIGAVIAAVVLCIKHWDTIKEVVINVGTTILAAVQTAWNAVTGVISGAVNAIAAFLAPAWETIKSVAMAAWEAIGSFLSNPIETAKNAIGVVVSFLTAALSDTWEGIKETAQTAWDAIGGFLSAPIEAAKNAIGLVVSFLTATLASSWEGIKTTAETAWNLISGFISDPIGTAKTTIESALSLLGINLGTAWTDIQEAASTAWSAISGFINIDSAKTAVGLAVGSLSTHLESAWLLIQSAAETAWTAVSTFMSDPIGTAKSTIGLAVSSLTTLLGKAWTGIQTAASTAWTTVSTFMSNPIKAAKTGIGKAVGTLTNLLSTAWDGIKTTASTVWTSIKTAITTPITLAKNKVKNVIDAIKGFFNFEITWPHIPVPKFAINPPGWQIGDLLKGSIPTIGITWEAKAKENPYMFTGATLFGAGEAGDEILYGRERLMNDIREAAGGGAPANNTFYITVDGAENPEDFADRLVRRLKLDMRTA